MTDLNTLGVTMIGNRDASGPRNTSSTYEMRVEERLEVSSGIELVVVTFRLITEA
jgi:hypothetical protein